MPENTWQLEHMERQGRVVLAIDIWISEHDAELLDDLDNLCRLLWLKGTPMLAISTN